MPESPRVKLELADFGRRLREKRIAAGIGQREIARLARVNRSHVQNIELRGANTSLATIVLLADAIGCEVIELFKPAPGR